MKVNGKDEGGMTERKIKKGLRIFKDEGSLSKVNK